MTIEQLLEILGDDLAGLSLWKTPDGWQGNARVKDSAGWRVHKDKDPTEAVRGALASLIATEKSFLD